MADDARSLFIEQFNRLSKQEKHVSGERQKIDSMKQELEEARRDAELYRSLKGRNPFEILEAYGIGYDKLIEADKSRASERQMSPYERQQQKEMRELKEFIMKDRQEKEESELRRRESMLMDEIKTTVKQQEFDVIENLDLYDVVKDHMSKHFEKEGTIPTYEEACRAVTEQTVSKFKSIKDSKWLSQDFSKPSESIGLKKDDKVNSKVVSETKSKPESAESDMQSMMAAMQKIKDKRSEPQKSVVMEAPETKKEVSSRPSSSESDKKAELLAALSQIK